MRPELAHPVKVLVARVALWISREGLVHDVVVAMMRIAPRVCMGCTRRGRPTATLLHTSMYVCVCTNYSIHP